MIAFFTAPAIVKLKVTIPALSATVIAQETLPSASPVPWWLDLGVTIAALRRRGGRATERTRRGTRRRANGKRRLFRASLRRSAR